MKFNNYIPSNSKNKTTCQGQGRGSRPHRKGKKKYVGQGRR